MDYDKLVRGISAELGILDGRGEFTSQLDSLDLVNLIVDLQGSIGYSFATDDLIPKNFSSIASVVSLIEKTSQPPATTQLEKRVDRDESGGTNYEIVRYCSDYKSQVADLRSRAYGGTPDFNVEYLEWKYEQNPYIDDPILHLALHHGSVVGMRGIYGSQWQFGSADPRIIPVGADLAIDANYRGQWLDTPLLAAGQEDLVAEGYDYILTASATLTTRLLRTHAGWKRAATYMTFRRGKFPKPNTPGRGPSLLTRALRRAGRIVSDRKSFVPFERFDKWAARVGHPYVATSDPRISLLSELASIHSDTTRIQHVRDERYYKWRLRDPRCHYRLVFHEQGGGPDGFFMLQQYFTGGAVTIVDWAVTSEDVWTKLLRKVVESKINRLQIRSTRFSEGQVQSLRQCGLELVEELDTQANPAPGVLLCALSKPDTDEWSIGGQRLLDEDQWDMRMLYSDAY